MEYSGSMKLLILAAGLGSRFGGAKQVEPIGPRGETLLEYSLFDAFRAGFTEAVFLIGESMKRDFEEKIISRLPRSVRCEFAFQSRESLVPEDLLGVVGANPRKKPWGTGHAVLCAEGNLPGPFAVMNADDYYGKQSLRAIHDFLAASDAEEGAGAKAKAPCFCFAAYPLADVVPPDGSVSRAICDLDRDGFLTGIVEHKRIRRALEGFVSAMPDGSIATLEGGACVSMNLWGFTPAFFPGGKRVFEAFVRANASSPSAEIYIPTIIDEMIGTGEARVRALPVKSRHFGLTNPEDAGTVRESLAELTAAGEYPSPLWKDFRLGR